MVQNVLSIARVPVCAEKMLDTAYRDVVPQNGSDDTHLTSSELRAGLRCLP